LVGVAEAEGPAAAGHRRCRSAAAFRPYRHPPRAARLSRQCTCSATKDPISQLQLRSNHLIIRCN
jgi:hypothetical protein